MSDTLPYTLWDKLRYTPLRDLLRGKMTARMDLSRVVEEAAVPVQVKGLVSRVVKRTRLWRLERVEVAQELLAHFADGIKAGESPESLIQQFGDEGQAATLIRRAKRRNRPMAWHFMRITAWSLVPVLLVYAGVALSFASRTPSPKVNYVAAINSKIESVPVEDRAWPLYRRVLLSVSGQWQQSFEGQADGKESPELLELVRTHPKELEWLREGAGKPTFGFLIGAGGSAFDPELWPNRKPPTVDPDTGEDLVGAAIPPIRMLNSLSSMLRADAVLARQDRDGRRLLRNIDSLVDMSRQIRRDGSLIVRMSAVSIYDTAVGQVERTLLESPDLVGADEWMALSRRLSEEKVAADMISYDTERLWFNDMLQRAFTDDGDGKGRLTSKGLHYFDFPPSDHEPVLDAWTIGPVFTILGPTREGLARDYNHVMDRAAANSKLPIRNVNWQDVQSALSESSRSLLTTINPMEIGKFTPGFWKLQELVERSLGRRDGVVVGIALEAYRRETGGYPSNLNALVPRFLAEVPADRMNGESIRYRLVNTRPVVYSVGGDGDDDGGRAAAFPDTAVNWGISPSRKIADGDWILYPDPK